MSDEDELKEMKEDPAFMGWLQNRFPDWESEPTTWILWMYRAWAEAYIRGYGDAPRN